MRKPQIVAVAALILLMSSVQFAFASLEGKPDFTNDRIVPLMTNPSDLNANGSGFLYSSRIVLTSGHTAYSFNSAGERQEFRPELSVGKPNSDIKNIGQGVRVIKRISAPGYLGNNNPDLNDFAVLVLEKDLIAAAPVQLLTPEIHRELLEKRAEVKIHGYGNTVDMCAPGESLPCKSNGYKASDIPRAITATLRPAGDFPELVGYQVQERLSDQLLFFTPGKSSMCGGDSGGSLTATYNGKLIYLANIGTAERIYACGQSRAFDGRGGVNYSQPIYKYLDLIRAAEDFVADQIAKEKSATSPMPSASPTSPLEKVVKKKVSIICIKGKVTKKVTAINPKCPPGYKKR